MSDLMRRKLDLIKVKLPSKTQMATALSLLHASLNVFKEVAGKTPVPGLSEGVKALVIVLEVIQKAWQNADDVESFAKCIQELTATLERATSGNASLSPSMQDRIQRLSQTWIASAERLQDIGSQSRLKRLAKFEIDAREIADVIATVTWSIHSFTVETMLAIEFSLDDARVHAQESAVRIEDKVDNVQRDIQDIKIGQHILAGVIPHAITARFDCNSKLQPCLEGTRQDVLYKIHQWIDHDMASPATENMVSCAENLQTAHIFWLNGPGSAGTGKTTIAYTIAKELHSQQKLGASFFCSRSRGECSNPKLIFPTIAYQLGQFYAPFGKVATAVVTSDPEVVYSVEHMQLEKLIVKPLEALQDAIPPCVVVIDGLDECQDGGATSTILASLAQYINKLVPLKFLITSRPDHHVFNGFEQSPLNQVTKRLVLHEIEPTVVATDIQLFLKSSLKATRQLYRLDELWPSEQEVNTLVQLSSGLFIFAATAIRFIHHESYNDPQGQLTCLLSAVVNLDYSAPKLLDWLYLQVLTNAYPDISPEFAGRLRLVLGSIIYLQNPLSASDIEWLLKPTISLQTTLRHLHSIVIFPSKQHESVQLIHPSFKDFLTDPTRCSNPKFLVNTKMQHSQLAQSCLNAMKILKRNICGLEPWMAHSEVVNFPALLQQCIPPALQYACCYWASHFSQALLTDELLDLLEDFCKSHLLHWVEVCSLLGELRNVLVALKTVQQSLLNINKGTSASITMMHDCQRFVREFYPLLSVASSQIYFSTPAFIPLNINLLQIHKNDFNDAVVALHYEGVPQQWQACLQTIEGHASVLSAVFSPNDAYIASASHDHMVHIWDTISGTHQQTFQGHLDKVTCVVFSPDGMHLLTGSDDNTVKLWDVVTGSLSKTWHGRNCVSSVAFSPIGDFVIAGFHDHTVQLYIPPWGNERGIHFQYFDEFEKAVTSVSVSPDTTSIAAGSMDASICLWNVVTGRILQKIRGHSAPVTCVTFSHSGTSVASGDVEGIIRVWDTKSGSQLKKLKKHSVWINSVSFSPDDTKIISAYERTIQLWDCNSGTHHRTFAGHSNSVMSAIFSSNGTQIVSASADCTLKIWDTKSLAEKKVVVKKNKIQTLGVSPNGSYVVSAMSDHTLELWNTLTGVKLKVLKGHLNQVNCVTFSSNSLQLVSSSADNTLRVWNTTTGTCIHVLKGHTDNVQSAKFPTNGLHLISCSFDKTVQVWDVSTGQHCHTFIGHSDRVYDLALSSSSTLAASASRDNTTRVWNLANKTQTRVFYGNAEMYAVVFSPDDAIVASESVDQSIWLWNILTGTNLKILKTQSVDPVYHQIHFSLDQQFIVADLFCLDTGLDLLALPASNVINLQGFPRYYMKDGWVISVASQCRICWIPQTHRGLLASTLHGVVLGTTAGEVIFLDFTQVEAYIEKHS